MRTIFLSATGHAYAELVKPFYRLIEMFDGYHPLVKEGVYRDSRRKDDAIVVVWHDVSGPEGSSMTKEFVKNVLLENEVLKQHRQKVSVSRMFWRKLVTWCVHGLRGGYFIFFCVIVFFFALLLYILVAM